ncbi:MAG: asparagine synthase C-terminal domain-containing protein [Clostridium sp.]|nr:MAG: asparagine synthase C-terminal domain-containing protein [Clostridium sp.]
MLIRIFVKYLYNVVFNYKYYDKTEKNILREAYINILPKEIYKRKKSPYPKKSK